MHHPPTTLLGRLQRWLVSPAVWAAVLHPTTRYVLAWVAALGGLAAIFCVSWFTFYNPHRNQADKTEGHTTIDFGGQWLMGRMLVEGHGRQLYVRDYQRHVLYQAYPVEDEVWGEHRPKDKKTDADSLMIWMMGSDSPQAAETVASFLTPLGAGGPDGAAALLAGGREHWTPERLEEVTARRVGGPLYPPINGYLCYPLALIDRPVVAYRVHQCFSLLLALAAGLAVRQLSQGRIWWPVGLAAVMTYPGFLGSLQLGQNALLTLTILLWGWVLLRQGREVGCGLVWGLLAFKPVWAMAFFLVPVLSGRWRLCLAMLASGAALAATTLPVVGFQSWLDWLHVGREASALYDTDENWIFLSRDVLSIPRRWLLNFQPGEERMPDWLTPAVVGWSLLVAFLEITVRVAVLRRRQARAYEGPPAAFLLLGAWLTCFHFMYYDVLLTLLPLALLATRPGRFLERAYLFFAVRRQPAGNEERADDDYYAPGLPQRLPPEPSAFAPRRLTVWVLNGVIPTLYVLLLATAFLFPLFNLGHHAGTPWDTFVLMAAWAWCGWLWLRTPQVEGKTDRVEAAPAGHRESPNGAAEREVGAAVNLS